MPVLFDEGIRNYEPTRTGNAKLGREKARDINRQNCVNTDLAIIDSVILRCVLLLLTIISQSLYPVRGDFCVAR
jgi:hypothetical protein